MHVVYLKGKREHIPGAAIGPAARITATKGQINLHSNINPRTNKNGLKYALLHLVR